MVSYEKARQHNDLFEGHERHTTKITARPPTKTEASILIQSRNLPILVTESINVDKHKQPIEYGVSRFAADRVQLVVET